MAVTSRASWPTAWSRFSAPSTSSTASTRRDASYSTSSATSSSGPRLGAGLDWKTSLQELTAERGVGVPAYEITATGPDHDKEFTATVIVGGKPLGVGIGRSKKEAEQKAASTAWNALSDAGPDVAADDVSA